MITIDFETKGIEDRPKFPPEPVGVSILYNGTPRYYAWGHPTKNNTTRAHAAEIMGKVWSSRHPILMHNAAFDMEVAMQAFDLPMLPTRRIHDTMILLFLVDPYGDLALKPAAERILGMAPEERDEVREWLVSHRIVKANDKKWGEHISEAPGDLVGRYANGDTVRTRALYDYLIEEVTRRDMLAAYGREINLMPMLMENSRRGIRVDRALLERHREVYVKAYQRAEKWLCGKLGVRNLNSDEAVAEALDSKGYVTSWKLTATGKRSTAKDAMTPDMFTDQKVAQAMGYRNRLATCLSTFINPWLEKSVSTGRLHPSWNQVRNFENGGVSGTRTGRPSTNKPNFLNIPKSFTDKGDGYVHPEFLKVPELPLLRRYILPEEGHMFLHRDLSQQEIRILAHFEDADLMRAYKENPALDVHTHMVEQIKSITGTELQRRTVKAIVFGILYGQGVGRTAESLGITVEEAAAVKAALLKAVPGLAELMNTVKMSARIGRPIRTWGGREYYVEPPKIIKGRMWSFEYKMLNTLIQGSAADFTKEALLRYQKMRIDSVFLTTVYDEINISAPIERAREEMELLKIAMNGVPGLDVPMLSEGKWGKSWGQLEKYVEQH